MNGVWHGGGTGLTDGRRAGGPAFFRGAALARVPGRDGRRWGGGVSGGISLPGPAFPFGLPAAFPVGLFLPAPFLPLPGLPFLLPAAGQFFLASGFPFLALPAPRSSRWRRASSSCRRRTSAWRWRSSRSACRRWRSSACRASRSARSWRFRSSRSSRSCSRLTCRSWASWARLACRSWASCWRRSSSSLRCCSRPLFSSLAWASSCCRASASRWRKAIFSCWRSCRLARRSSLVRSWNRRTSPTTTRAKAISSSSRT